MIRTPHDSLGRVIDAMTDALTHRGPDDRGTVVSDDGGIALGMRRLSIVDLEGGAQPMWSRDGRVCVVFNGEIYNAPELRRELLGLGRPFATDHSDTEVLVQGYAEWGVGLLERLNGMFAFVVWDVNAGQLLLARDRVGEKPAFIAELPDGFAVGSEMKAILQCPGVDRQLDFSAVEQFFAFDYIIGPRTPFAKVKKLAAGHYALLTAKSCTIHPYWRPSFSELAPSFEVATRTFDDLMADAVQRRMVADVPLGLFLSGGLDSTTVGWYMRRYSSEVESFSIGFDDSSFDESSYAALAAKALGTKHHVEVFSQDRLKDLVPRVSQLLDEPMGDQSIFPTYLLSLFTREHVKVALGGDGSDELLMGYKAYQPLKVAWMLERLRLVGGAAALARRAPATLGPVPLRGRRFASTLDESAAGRQLGLLASFGANARGIFTSDVRSQLPPSVLAEPVATIEDHGGAGLNGANSTAAAYLRGYLQEDILVKVDRASMAASLEVRAPFLDPRIVDFVLSMPERHKLRGFTGKHLLRHLMRGRIPDEIIDRRKAGFGVPLNRWLRESLAPMVREYLDPVRLDRDGIFDSHVVKRIVDQHLSGSADLGHQVWLLLLFETWRERWAT